jgi:hypothetical protein
LVFVTSKVHLGEQGVRPAQKTEVGPRIPVGVQLEKTEVGPTPGPTWRLAHFGGVVVDAAEDNRLRAVLAQHVRGVRAGRHGGLRGPDAVADGALVDVVRAGGVQRVVGGALLAVGAQAAVLAVDVRRVTERAVAVMSVR